MTFRIGRYSEVVPTIAATLFALLGFATTPLFAVTINGESRLTQEQFAARNGQSLSGVKSTFAASGRLECKNGRMRYRSTAQLVGRNDIVVTVAHAFINTDTCRKIVRPDQCTFTTHDGRRSVVRAFDLVAIGQCPAPGAKGDADWAVLKLRASIPTVVPYEIGEWSQAADGARVLSVSAQSQDFYLNGALRNEVKTIDDCSIRRVLVSGLSGRLLTDCDVAPGNSGGALLAKDPSGVHRVLGISIGSTVLGGGKKSRNAPRDAVYQERAWSAHAVALVGPFRHALELATGRPISKSSVFVGYPAATSRIAPIIPEAKGGTFLPFTRINTPFPPIPRAPQLCDERVALDECWTVGAPAQ